MPRVKRAKLNVTSQGELFTQQTIRGINRIVPNPQVLLRLKRQVAKSRSKSVVTLAKLDELKQLVNVLPGQITQGKNEIEKIALTEQLKQIQNTLSRSKELFRMPRNKQVLMNRLRTPLKEALASQGVLLEQQKQYLKWYLSASKKGRAWTYYDNARKIVNSYREKIGKALVD